MQQAADYLLVDEESSSSDLQTDTEVHYAILCAQLKQQLRAEGLRESVDSSAVADCQFDAAAEQLTALHSEALPSDVTVGGVRQAVVAWLREHGNALFDAATFPLDLGYKNSLQGEFIEQG